MDMGSTHEEDSWVNAEGSLVRNFRPLAGGGGRIFRSANTDVLADRPLLIQTRTGGETTPSSDDFILQHVTLVVDLRSPLERDEAKVREWSSAALGGFFRVLDDGELHMEKFVDARQGRCIVRLAMTDKITHRSHQVLDIHGNTKTVIGFEQLVSFINEEGLLGLYKILLCLHDSIVKCLTIITIHLEADVENQVLIHCVQGKDRTGMIGMLVQCVAGASDVAISTDYARSHGQIPKHDMLQAVVVSDRKLTMADQIQSVDISQDAPASVMMETLDYLRARYGTVRNYLNRIGFDSSWQERLRVVLQGSTAHASRL